MALATALSMRVWISASDTWATTDEALGTPETCPTGAGRTSWETSGETRSATDNMAAEANPRRAEEPQNAAHPRRHGEGSKTLSETNAMRWDLFVPERKQG